MLDLKKELENFCQENNVLQDHISSWEMSLREMANGIFFSRSFEVKAQWSFSDHSLSCLCVCPSIHLQTNFGTNLIG